MSEIAGRVLLTVALAGVGLPAAAQEREGVNVGRNSAFNSLVSAQQVEQAGQQQYAKIKSDAARKGTLAGPQHPQLVRLKYIASRIIPHSPEWNARAQQWPWEVNLITSKEINAFCMPGGKIAFYTGILDTLKLTDDEVAMIMGHEVAHALREHARERMGKGMATQVGASIISSLLGLGSAGDALLNMGGELLTLKFSRGDESEADLIGMELAARAGYDPRAGVTLWRKMAAANKGAPPEFMSTHPSSSTRIEEIEANLPKVMPIFERAPRPTRRFDAPRQVGFNEAGAPGSSQEGGQASRSERPRTEARAVPAEPARLASGTETRSEPRRTDNVGWVRVTP